MQIEKLLNIPEDANIEYLKEIITKDDLLLLYWIISQYAEEFSEEQLDAIEKFLSYFDNDLIEDDDQE